MIFHRRRRKIDTHNPSLNNTVLQRSNYRKFLGVIIDDGLKWTNDIAHVKNKIAKMFGIILIARKIYNNKILLNFDHAFIYPYLVYCTVIWCNEMYIHLIFNNYTTEENCENNNVLMVFSSYCKQFY